MTTLFENAFVLNVVSDDHPGIVATIVQTVQAHGGNIDACSQTVLKGYFTLIMVVSFPEPVDVDTLHQELVSHPSRGSTLQVLATPFRKAEATEPSAPAERFVVTAFGHDKPGIVLRFSRYLAGKDINIVDLYGDRTGDDFVLVGQVDIPQRLNLAMLQADLEEMGREEGFTVRLQHEDIFVATNQLRLRRS